MKNKSSKFTGATDRGECVFWFCVLYDFLSFGVGELRATVLIHEPAGAFPAGCGMGVRLGA